MVVVVVCCCFLINIIVESPWARRVGVTIGNSVPESPLSRVRVSPRILWIVVGLFFAPCTFAYLDVSIGYLESGKKRRMVPPHGGWSRYRNLFTTFGISIGDSVKQRVLWS